MVVGWVDSSSCQSGRMDTQSSVRVMAEHHWVLSLPSPPVSRVQLRVPGELCATETSVSTVGFSLNEEDKNIRSGAPMRQTNDL